MLSLSIAVSALFISLAALVLVMRRVRVSAPTDIDPAVVAQQAVVAAAQLHKGRTDDAAKQDMARAATEHLMTSVPSLSASSARMLIEYAVAESKK